MTTEQSFLDALEKRLGSQWLNIRKARETTVAQRATLNRAFQNSVAADTSVVLFGSIARGEVTSGSDADWILLLDGQAYPEHQEQKRDVIRILEEEGFGEPGRSGVFGCMVSSHGLVHEIGGEDDTNSNTTRRVLLLLESFAVGNMEPYIRVRRQILNRYIRDDRGLIFGTGGLKVPRFLLNDVTRYWRTITVDFVYKQRADAGEKWALRNAKLRMSRKLVFASGLLRCFFCQIDSEAARAREQLIATKDPAELLDYLEADLDTPPLELLARAATRDGVAVSTAKKLFDSYESFLGILDKRERRDALKNVRQERLLTSPEWAEVREIGHQFQEGLTELFYRSDEQLKELTITYGVF